MAQIEPMDIESDFEDKENSIKHSNVLPRTSCTEKGYEELDVSEMNMKLRYSITPASSPMSKSYTSSCRDNTASDNNKNGSILSNNVLSSSLNSTLTYDNKLSKMHPLQPLSTDHLVDLNGNPLVRRSLDVDSNVSIIVNENHVDEHLSLPSTSSSATHTPEATTPTKEMPKDGGSPIMRGLKSVFSMFRSSQSPILPGEDVSLQKNLSPIVDCPTEVSQSKHLVSTPIIKNKEAVSLRNSPLKDSVVFNDDLEKELQWKEETTIIFKNEKIPIHKLFSQQLPLNYLDPTQSTGTNEEQNITVEYMDVSQNIVEEIGVEPTTVFSESINALESDGEFVDCETTITKNDLDMSVASIGDLNNVNTLNISSNLTEKSNDIEAQEKSTINVDFLSDLDVIKAIDTITECNSTPYHNQFKENDKQGEKKIIETNIECTVLKKVQECMVESCNNVEDNRASVLVLPDIVSLPIHVNAIASNEISSCNSHDSSDTKENVFDKFIIEECAKLTVEENALIVDTLHVNNNDKLKEKAINEQNVSCIETNSLIDSKCVSINATDKDVMDISTVTTNQAINIILTQTIDIAHLNSGEYDSVKIISKEIDKNNLSSTSDCEQLQDNFSKQVLTEEPDVQVLSTVQKLHHVVMRSDKSCDKETIKLNDVINNYIEKQKVDAIYSNSTMVLLKSERSSTPLEQPTNYLSIEKSALPNEISNATEAAEENNFCEISNLTPQLHDFNILKDNSENTNLPSDIPLPSDSELEQECGKEVLFKKATNSSFNLSSTTNLMYSDKVDQNFNENTDGRLLLIENAREFDKELEIFNSIDIRTPINSEDINSTFNNNSHDCEDVKSVDGLESINCADPTANSNMTADINKNICGLNDDFNSTITQNVNHNYTTILNSNVEVKDTITGNTDKCSLNNSMNFSDTSISAPMSSNSLNDQHKIDYDEEIITSAGSSPYVSVTDMAINSIIQDEITLEDIENPFITKTRITETPPISPKLVSNFNFDDIADPFATKTKIRVSPTPDSPKQQTIVPIAQDNKSKKKNNIQQKREKNKRKSQTDRKSLSTSKNFNKTFHSDNEHNQHLDSQNRSYTASVYRDNTLEAINNLHKINDTAQIIGNSKQQGTEIAGALGHCCVAVDEFQNVQVDDRNSLTNDFSIEHVNDQPEIIAENVLALPCVFEPSSNHDITKTANITSLSISDVEPHDNNEKVVKSIMVIETKGGIIEHPKIEKEYSSHINTATFISKQKDEYCTVKDSSDCEDVDKECSPNISIAACSSKITDENRTVREINTEDEDTIEGPFLEADGDFDHNHDFRDFASNKDMMQFGSADTCQKDENIDNGELFIDAETFEFLLNQNKSTVIADSGKESLFLKFDPLYAKRVSSEGVLAALSKIQKMQSTPKKIARLSNEDVNTEIPSSSNTDFNYDEVRDDPDLSAPKPMMVVNPAVNPIGVTRKISTPKLNRRSLTFTSPAIAVIDRLLSLSENNSYIDQNTSLPRSSVEHNETDIAITQLREMLADKEIHVHDLRIESKELKERLSSLESQMKTLETESEQRLKKVNDLNERLTEKTKINRSMAVVVEEYERTIASLITEMEHEKKHNSEERMKLVKERDEQTAHLASMEVSFNDLHSKYEKSKQIILSMKANEDTYKKSIQDFEDNLLKMQNNYELLKQHATSKLNHANQELEKYNKAHESEVLKLNALIKRKEMHITSLEETLNQKTKANEELTAICDELINKVG